MTRAGIPTGALLALLALGVGGCGAVAPHPPLPGLMREAGPSLAIAVRPAYQLQAIAHRWVTADIHQYDVTLRAWNGEAFVALSPAVTVVLPQKSSSARQRAVFTNLKQGLRYQATVLARGNVGGSAPDQVLNAQSPTRLTFSFESSQDVSAALAREAVITLDAVPFSGSVTLQPADQPPGTDGYAVRLEEAESGEARYVGTYAATQTMVLRHLRVGTPYRVRLSALAAGVPLQETTSAPIVFDSQGQDLEQALTVLIAF